jgi:beta-galactosidase
VFCDVAELGKALAQLDDVVGTGTDARTAIIFDREIRWAFTTLNGFRSEGDKGYLQTVTDHYHALWKRSVPMDVISSEAAFTPYKLIIAPMLYMIKPGVAERLTAFAENGGRLVLTYLSGITDENDLCFMGGWPGPLRALAGVWVEEIDTLPDGAENLVRGTLNPDDVFSTKNYCELSHLETATALAVYDTDFYAGRPAVTVNQVGHGKVYYVGFQGGDDFLAHFYEKVTQDAKIINPLGIDLPDGVTVTGRTDGVFDYLFIFNFNPTPESFTLPNLPFTDMLTGLKAEAHVVLAPFDTRVLRAPTT